MCLETQGNSSRNLHHFSVWSDTAGLNFLVQQARRPGQEWTSGEARLCIKAGPTSSTPAQPWSSVWSSLALAEHLADWSDRPGHSEQGLKLRNNKTCRAVLGKDKVGLRPKARHLRASVAHRGAGQHTRTVSLTPASRKVDDMPKQTHYLPRALQGGCVRRYSQTTEWIRVMSPSNCNSNVFDYITNQMLKLKMIYFFQLAIAI